MSCLKLLLPPKHSIRRMPSADIVTEAQWQNEPGRSRGWERGPNEARFAVASPVVSVTELPNLAVRQGSNHFQD